MARYTKVLKSLAHNAVGNKRIESAAPAGNNYYMFSKDNTVNLASVLGYHAEVQFVNNSSKKAEMFSVGSIIQLNSK